MPAAEGSASKGRLAGLTPLVAKSLVNQVVDAIVEAAAKGVFLPGDRLVEAELARSLNVSRIPVREALRLLESQGVVVSERYRGMSLMSVDIDRLEKILKVRLALEKLAGVEVMAKLKTDPTALAPLEKVLAEMHKAGRADDGFRVASLDTEFHQMLCALSGNEVLLRTFEPLSRQLTIIFGLSVMKKGVQSIVEEHDELLEVLRGGDQAAFDALMQVHILDYSRAVDYEHFVEQLRKLEHRRKTG
ncbi:MAG: GntR family transcriptional regulator [Devosia sp.]|jgi:DNA-binding GntR family transcriptional regulator|uniref:GntR family transcriptional regulator n=1 Tax=Devosia sp. TaxID=1871048 RepID=UPI000AF18D46|nr:GntR family transcriptional regulator [Devosia sp.]MBL8597751.1 GntR family transcriptional regulator [Devosia sp.]MBN9345365.1 GntR family transcriptional regulator [Devosia sp.]